MSRGAKRTTIPVRVSDRRLRFFTRGGGKLAALGGNYKLSQRRQLIALFTTRRGGN